MLQITNNNKEEINNIQISNNGNNNSIINSQQQDSILAKIKEIGIKFIDNNHQRTVRVNIISMKNRRQWNNKIKGMNRDIFNNKMQSISCKNKESINNNNMQIKPIIVCNSKN